VPSGACVLRYDGKRGTVWKIKFLDAAGRQVKETLGRAADGWTKRKAEAPLRARLTDFARDGYKRPEPTEFETFAGEWLDTYPDAASIGARPARSRTPSVPASRGRAGTIVSPAEIAVLMRAFDDLIAGAETDTERAWRQTAKAMTMQYAWLRRGELLGLKWRDVELTNPDGPRLHVRETWVRGHQSLPKTDDGARTIGIDGPLAEELWQHRRRTRFAGMTRGHSDFKTTQRYIDLAGVVFGDEVQRLAAWYAGTGNKNRYQVGSKEAQTRMDSGDAAIPDSIKTI
jgi:integrase